MAPAAAAGNPLRAFAADGELPVLQFSWELVCHRDGLLYVTGWFLYGRREGGNARSIPDGGHVLLALAPLRWLSLAPCRETSWHAEDIVPADVDWTAAVAAARVRLAGGSS